jgi:hypothetical protein
MVDKVNSIIVKIKNVSETIKYAANYLSSLSDWISSIPVFPKFKKDRDKSEPIT